MASVDFVRVRELIAIQRVLEFVGFTTTERRGMQLRGPCPIHRSQSSRSRSFSVNLSKNAFRCFGCGAQGNQLDLWAQITQLPLVEAAEQLCRRAGVSVPRLPTSNCRERHSTVTEKRNP